MLFFNGWHQPSSGERGTKHFEYCMVSINRLLRRKSDFTVNNWILDSGAFSRISSQKGHLPVKEYAKHVMRWSKCGNLLAAVSQDYLCDDISLAATGLTVAEHQSLTIQRYDFLLNELPSNHPYVMPVLQGREPIDYVNHLNQYGDRLEQNAWVGVGSVCSKNSSPELVRRILKAIEKERPDFRLHGFGLKMTALRLGGIREMLYSVDSQAHSFGRVGQKKFANANDPHQAILYRQEVLSWYQLELPI